MGKMVILGPRKSLIQVLVWGIVYFMSTMLISLPILKMHILPSAVLM